MQIQDRNGVVLYDQRQGGLSQQKALSEIPLPVIQALIATEDRTFWTNPGVSLRGIGRAFIHNLNAGKLVEGGSTLTQQYVRSRINPNGPRGIGYKIREAWLAFKVFSRTSKNDLLERYLNETYFGSQAYGVAAASRVFFDKNLSELSLGESALLVGLLNAPTALNPFKDSASAKERRDLVLRAMRATGSISDDQQTEALAEPVKLTRKKIEINAPHFVMWQLQENGEEWAKESHIRTTLDAALQSEVELIVANQLEKLSEQRVTSAAVVVLDAHTGELLSMVGSADYFDDEHDGQVNVALAPRQPGSAIKPFTYALALTQGMTPASTVIDNEAQFFTQEGNPYTPRNYDYNYHGLVRLREALANSYNIAAVKVMQRVGVERLLTFLKHIGISTLSESPEHYGLALTLGDSEVKLLELARAFAIFPRNGRTLVLRTALSDSKNNGEEVLDSRIAWLISDILSDNDARTAEFGRSSALNFDFPVAAKTGTTRNSRDNWAIGFTPSRIVGVWVGNADNTPMRGTSGVTGAGPIFHDVMVAATSGLPREEFIRPAGIVDHVICRLSGKLMTPLCPTSLTEHFVKGTEPKENDDMYRAVSIDSRNGLLASTACDPRFVTVTVFAFFPPELQRWARENGFKQAPVKYSPLCPSLSDLDGAENSQAQKIDRWITIISPADSASFLLDPLIPMSRQLVTLEASADQTVQSLEWFIDGKSIGTAQAPDFHRTWEPKVGAFKIEAIAGDLHETVNIEVQKP